MGLDKDTVFFKDKSFSDLLEDVYDNVKTKRTQIDILINELKPFMKNIGDAAVIVPLIKEYMEVAVKNDEHIVKVVAVIQRLISTGMRGTDDGDILTEAEKEQLLHELDEVAEEVQNRLDDNEVASKTAMG
jgi:hypothetical protein